MDRHDFMTSAQKMLWDAAEQELSVKLNRKISIPRTHENCIKILGVARPGKTRQDRARNE